MKRIAPFFILLAASLAPAPLAAQAAEHLPLNTIVVKHFTNANGMTQSPDFAKFFSDYICVSLAKDKLASQVVDQDTAVPAIVPTNSVQIEGKFLSHEDAGLIKPGKLTVEISLYRLSDHALVRTLTPATKFPPKGDNKDRVYAYYTGTAAAEAIWDALKSVDLSSIPPAAAGPSAATSSPAIPAPPATSSSATAPAASDSTAPAPSPSALAPAGSASAAPPSPDALASVQLSSDPAGADIAIDGSYIGNTPTLIKLKPGTHSIKMTMSGYAPWERSIETAAGESRNFAATLEKSSQ